jgi:hypothetical protein
MMSGNTRLMKNRHPGAIRNILLVSLSAFFLSVLAIAFHHHDTAFWLSACSICKAKSALSGTVSIYKIDSVPAAGEAIRRGPVAGLAGVSGWVPDFRSGHIPFPPGIPFPNKAPPVLS